jgi:hypothetical protein
MIRMQRFLIIWMEVGGVAVIGGKPNDPSHIVNRKGLEGINMM